MQSIQNSIAFKNESSHVYEKWIFETFVGFEVFLKEARIPPLTKEKWPSAVYPVAGITAGRQGWKPGLHHKDNSDKNIRTTHKKIRSGYETLSRPKLLTNISSSPLANQESSHLFLYRNKTDIHLFLLFCHACFAKLIPRDAYTVVKIISHEIYL